MKSKIDQKLHELCNIQKPGQTYTRDELAALCNCDKELIRQFELRALKKVRRRLGEEQIATLRKLFERG